MPIYPAIEEQKPDEPIDPAEDNLRYTFGQQFDASLLSTGERILDTQVLTRAPLTAFPNSSNLAMQPVTQDLVDEWKKERPNLPNIPIGMPRYVGSAIIDMYDNDANLARMQQASPGIISKAAAFGGATFGSFLDIPATAKGLISGGVGAFGFQTLASKAISRFASSKIFGSQAARVGTQLAARGAGTGGAFGLGYQTEAEKTQNTAKERLGEPYSYLESLQNIGVSGLYGMVFGAGAELLGAGVAGAKGVRTPEGNFELREPQEGEVATREGGLLNRPEFKNLAQSAKDQIGKLYKPWSTDSNITMTEEAAGHMMNGQVPNVDIIMKQGLADEGINFRQAMTDSKIDITEFDRNLTEADSNVRQELIAALKVRDDLLASDKQISKDETVAITENKSLSQIGILEAFKKAQYNANLVENAPELIPQNVKNHLALQEKIDKLQSKIDQSAGEPNKQTIRRIKELRKQQPKILTPKRELSAIKNELVSRLGTASYETVEAFQRLSDLAKVWKSAKNLLDNLNLRHVQEKHIANLSNHAAIIKTMQDHIGGTHEAVTASDIKDYSEHLQRPGIPENGTTTLPERSGVTIDDYLNEFTPDEIKQIAEGVPNEAIKGEIEKSVKRLSNIDRFKEMTKNIAGCLLREID